MDKKSLSHTAWKCQYHIVFIPKYRKKSLYGQIRADVREIIRTLCSYKGVEIVDGIVCIDHVHRGYYVATVGNLTEDAIRKYIQEQSEESRREYRKEAAF